MKVKRETLLQIEKSADQKLLYFLLSKYKKKDGLQENTQKKSKGWERVNVRISTGDTAPGKTEMLRNSE